MPQGRVLQIHLKVGRRRPMQRVPLANAVAGKGLVGDVAFGRARRQLLLTDLADLDHFHLQPGEVRENITLAGVPLADLPRGSRLQLGDVTVEITGDCTPCEQLEDLRPGLQEDIRGRRGMLARVVKGGMLREGDPAYLDSSDS
ncbi:MAG: MOSC domain-containing protein [Anaerolineales bacterium]